MNEDVGHMVHRRPIPRKGGVRHERQRLQRPVEILPLALKEGIARQGVGDPVVSARKDADDLVIVECGDAEADRLAEGNCREQEQSRRMKKFSGTVTTRSPFSRGDFLPSRSCSAPAYSLSRTRRAWRRLMAILLQIGLNARVAEPLGLAPERASARAVALVEFDAAEIEHGLGKMRIEVYCLLKIRRRVSIIAPLAQERTAIIVGSGEAGIEPDGSIVIGERAGSIPGHRFPPAEIAESERIGSIERHRPSQVGDCPGIVAHESLAVAAVIEGHRVAGKETDCGIEVADRAPHVPAVRPKFAAVVKSERRLRIGPIAWL